VTSGPTVATSEERAEESTGGLNTAEPTAFIAAIEAAVEAISAVDDPNTIALAFTKTAKPTETEEPTEPQQPMESQKHETKAPTETQQPMETQTPTKTDAPTYIEANELMEMEANVESETDNGTGGATDKV
jgi:hypothetical protein